MGLVKDENTRISSRTGRPSWPWVTTTAAWAGCIFVSGNARRPSAKAWRCGLLL